VPGVTDLAPYQAGVIPQLRLDLDREAIARRGLAVADIQRTIEVALGGEPATEVWQGERRYAVTVRLPDRVRADPDELGRLMVGPAEQRVSLGEIARVSTVMGRTSVWREDFSRFVAVKFNVRGRDLGSTVEEARRTVEGLPTPEGTYLTWSGEFQNQARALKRLALSLPVAIGAIAVILYGNFRQARPVAFIMAMLPFAVGGAVAGLRLMGENFSVSSAVGCIALVGQVVLAGIVVCSKIDETRERHGDPWVGVGEAFRPVMLTSSIALFGLVPAALSHAMGSETQRPFAIAIIAGLLAGVPTVLLLLPLFYRPLQRRVSP
jgi:cobalt-zinc-cadmium resistance protein CzcA